MCLPRKLIYILGLELRKCIVCYRQLYCLRSVWERYLLLLEMQLLLRQGVIV